MIALCRCGKEAWWWVSDRNIASGASRAVVDFGVADSQKNWNNSKVVSSFRVPRGAPWVRHVGGIPGRCRHLAVPLTLRRPNASK